ncbi:MAG: hypothetical protein ABSH28_11110 [Acidobacteriota bacterium]
MRVRCLAYPYGAHDRHVRSRARALFESARGTEPAYARSSSDLFALPRVDMYYLRPAGLFRALETGRLAGYLLLRRWLRKARMR